MLLVLVKREISKYLNTALLLNNVKNIDIHIKSFKIQVEFNYVIIFTSLETVSANYMLSYQTSYINVTLYSRFI